MASLAGAPRLPAAASTLVTPVLPSDGYKLALRVESEADFLLLLAKFPLDAGGAFSVAVDLALRVDPPLAGQGRVLLRLLACDAAASAEIERLALASADPLAPRYCAMPGGRTLADLCAAFPLADRAAGDAVVYRAQAVVSGSAVRDLGIRASSAPGPTSFFLDACEAVGGANGALASCLEPAGTGGECFRCAGVPPVGANCSVSPAIRPALTGGVRMDLCDASGECLTSAGAFASLPLFYALASLVWAAAAFLWSVHIQAASGRPPRARHARRRGNGGEIGGPTATAAAVPAAVDGRSASRRGSRESGRASSGRLAGVSAALSPPSPSPAAQVVVELQLKMRGVPLSQSLASALAAAALFLEGSPAYTSGRVGGSSASPTALSSLASNAAALAAALALALLCEMLLLLAKGWQITRSTLPARERQWLRALSAAFALLTAALRHSRRAKHLAVALLWGAAWAALVGAIWFHSALNLNALRYQLAVLRQHLLALQQQQQRQRQDQQQQGQQAPDVRRTPVYVKLQLFRRFRALLALYLLLACVLGVAGLAADAADPAWQWTTLAAADGLTLLLAAALGHTFRCRRFRELLPPLDAAAGGGGPHRVAPEPQQPVEPAPPPLARAKSAMVVVVSPGQEHALGTAYAPAADAKKEPT